MDQATHNKIVPFIWGIADDVLRDCCCRPKTDHLCRLKIDQGWKPGAAAPGVV